MITFDPVSIDNPRWEAAPTAYKALGSQHYGTPRFNQTNLLTRDQVRTTLATAWKHLRGFRRRYDPHGRLVNPYFRELLGSG